MNHPVTNTLRAGLALLVLTFAGCAISRDIQEVSRPDEMPPLEKLDKNLHYEDQNPDQPGQ